MALAGRSLNERFYSQSLKITVETDVNQEYFRRFKNKK